MKQLLFVTFVFLYVLSPAWAASLSTGAMSPDNYISKYAPIAIEEMYRSNIPASITLAQGIIESSWGGSELAATHKNHFGIKCNTGWEGIHTYHEDDDYDENGNLMESCFRGYYSVEESYKDHSNFLMRGERYSKLFDLGTDDFVNWAIGLKECGYATDPEYAQKLINTINKYGLYNFDGPDKPVATIATPAPMPIVEVEMEVFYLPKDYQPGMYDDMIVDAPTPQVQQQAHVAPVYDLGTYKGMYSPHNDEKKKKPETKKKIIVERKGNVIQMSTTPRSKAVRRN